MIPPKRLVWIDLEMTGLRPKIDVISEVAVIVTDFSLNEIETYSSAVLHEEDTLRRLMAESPWHVAQPEYVDVIVSACKSGKPESVVQEDILKLLKRTKSLNHNPESFPFFPDSLEAKGEVYLAGNSIGTDRAFIDEKWPLLARTLHYRMLDVSSFKLWHSGNYRTSFKKQPTHRALDDIRDSIAELRYYVERDDRI
jgi:oligoribonuclease